MTADRTPPPAVVTAAVALARLAERDEDVAAEAIRAASDPGHVLSARAVTVLGGLGLLDGNGDLRDTTREAALAWRPGKEADGG